MSNSHRAWLALGLLAIVLVVGACSASQDESVTQGDATRGRDLWVQSACVGCHGIDAQGSRGGPALANTPLTIRETISIVRRGGPGMPEYSASEISAQELQDMYAWFQNPLPVATGELEQDPWLQAGCGGCHGTRGEGGSAPGLIGEGISYGEFQRVVREGAEGMPAYGTSRISDTELQRLFDWLQAQAQPPAATGELGREPWTQAGCGGCHGANGEGGSAPGLTGEAHSYDEFRRVVRGGAEGMPAYGTSQISDTDLQRLFDWLQAQAQPPAATGELGREPWTQAGCGGCHGANGEGGSAPSLTGEAHSYDEFRRVVRGGAEGMPAYGTSQISDADLQRMYDWLKAAP
jgi:mono/diheme cytochrome c family protein